MVHCIQATAAVAVSEYCPSQLLPSQAACNIEDTGAAEDSADTHDPAADPRGTEEGGLEAIAKGKGGEATGPSWSSRGYDGECTHKNGTGRDARDLRESGTRREFDDACEEEAG